MITEFFIKWGLVFVKWIVKLLTLWLPTNLGTEGTQYLVSTIYSLRKINQFFPVDTFLAITSSIFLIETGFLMWFFATYIYRLIRGK